MRSRPPACHSRSPCPSSADATWVIRPPSTAISTAPPARRQGRTPRMTRSCTALRQHDDGLLLGLDAGLLHELAVLVELALKIFPKLRRRARDRHRARGIEFLFYVGRPQGGLEFVAQALDDRLRRAGRRADARPRLFLITAHAAFRDRRHVRKLRH